MGIVSRILFNDSEVVLEICWGARATQMKWVITVYCCCVLWRFEMIFEMNSENHIDLDFVKIFGKLKSVSAQPTLASA